MKLYDWVYDSHSMRSVTEEVFFSAPVISDSRDETILVPERDSAIFARDDAEIKLKAQLPWFVFKPVKRGETGGKVSIYVDGKEAGEYYLIYSEDYIQ